MRGWMNDERIMIACCSDGTRPVIFKIERIDYKAVYVNGIHCDTCRNNISETLKNISEVTDIAFKKDNNNNGYIEVFIDKDISNNLIESTIKSCGKYQVIHID